MNKEYVIRYTDNGGTLYQIPHPTDVAKCTYQENDVPWTITIPKKGVDINAAYRRAEYCYRRPGSITCSIEVIELCIKNMQ